MATLHVQYAFLISSHPLCLRMRNAADKSCRETRYRHYVVHI